MSHKASIVIADDQAENLLLLEEMLQEEYQVRSFPDGADVRHYVDQGGQADLFLLDIVMPLVDGFTLCRHLKMQPAVREVPVIFITSLEDPETEARGLALGAVDFIHKPFSMPGIKARLKTHLQLARSGRQLREHNQNLETLVAQRTREYMEQTQELLHRKQQVIAGQEATIQAFCSLAEARDNETGNHIRRTQNYIRILAMELQDHPQFRTHLSDEVITLLYKSAPLHDIGKVGIPDRILLKPGPLDDAEWETMRQHCRIGRDAISQVAQEVGEDNDFLRFGMEIAYGHHERWDGSGYPQGLSGEAIPVSARLMAVADVYDALISRRVYKPAYPHHEAMAHIREQAGKHFDATVVAALVAQERAFVRTANEFCD